MSHPLINREDANSLPLRPLGGEGRGEVGTFNSRFMRSFDLRFRTRIGTLNHSSVGSSRREALLSFRPRSLSLLTSAATGRRFMESLQ
jgi:hypothetical protein